MNPCTLKKTCARWRSPRVNRLPLINLVESGGADLPTQAELFVPGGPDLPRPHPAVGAGDPDDRARVRQLDRRRRLRARHVRLLGDGRRAGAKVFLGGPPLVKMATGEEADDEELGGAEMHVAHLRAGRLLRRRRARLHPHRPRDRRATSTGASSGPRPTRPADEPRLRPRGAARHRVRPTCGCRSTRARCIARIVDGSRFDEFKPLLRHQPRRPAGRRSTAIPVGILANARACCSARRRRRPPQFIQLANQTDTPLLFLQNTTGYMVGKDYEQGGHHQGRRQDDQRGRQLHGAAPHGDHGRRRYGAGQLRHVRPRLRPAVPVHLAQRQDRGDGSRSSSPACCRSSRGSRPRRTGSEFDEEADARSSAQAIEDQIERESLALFITGAALRRRHHRPARHPHRARHRALRRALTTPVAGPRGFGVFRM